MSEPVEEPVPGRDDDVRRVAEAAFARFAEGLGTGRWEPFLEMVTDDFRLSFPIGKYRGTHVGRERAAEFFRYVSETFPDGLELERERTTIAGDTAVFEFRDWGTLRGEPYRNRVALSFDIRDGMVCAYREYFGSPD